MSNILDVTTDTSHDVLRERLSRRAWARADRLWVSLEGRVLPQPVSPRVRGPHGLVAQYLLGNPRLGVETAADVA